MINSFRVTANPNFSEYRVPGASGFLPALLVFLALLFSAATPAPLQAQTRSLAERFSYSGTMFFQGFYLARDLPLEKQTSSVCPPLNSTGASVRSRCREEQDFFRMRLRLDLSFRPSQNVDILYGLEVGFLTFGEDSPSLSGPSTGGQGSGRTNLETREVRIRLRNDADTLHLNLGVFPIGTPQGIVLASSGAGARAVWDARALDSILEFVYIRSIDNSRVDDDSNGFSDENYAQIRLAMLTWKYSGIRGLKIETYLVHRGDNDPTSNDPTESNNETSRVFWGGIYGQWKSGPWKIILHAVGNGGTFERAYTIRPPVSYWLGLVPEINTIYNQFLTNQATLAEDAKLRQKHSIAAAAGAFELSYRLNDGMSLAATAAAGSGRLGTEPDGGSVDFRKDQFRTAGSGFQFSEIGVDSSGGYSLFSDGRLTGVVERGVLLRTRLLSNLEAEFGYFHLALFRSPTIQGNNFYKLYEDTDRVTNYLGQELNASFVWKALSGLTVTARMAYFNAGNAYKILNDVEYGDEIAEISLAVKQAF